MYAITPYGRSWAIRDRSGELIALTVYKKGAMEVRRRLETPPTCNACWMLLRRTT